MHVGTVEVISCFKQHLVSKMTESNQHKMPEWEHPAPNTINPVTEFREFVTKKVSFFLSGRLSRTGSQGMTIAPRRILPISKSG